MESGFFVLSIYQVLPNSHFFRNGLMRRMFEVIMLKPMTSRAKSTESVVSVIKLC